MSDDDSDEAGALSDLKENYQRPGHPIAYSGVGKVYEYYDGAIPVKAVKKYLSSVDVYTEHRESKRPKPVNPTWVYYLRQNWQGDLVEVGKFKDANNGVRYLLVVIDCWSRKAFVQPMLDKTGESTTRAFRQILDDAESPCERFYTDLGSEFRNEQFRALCAEHNIMLAHCFTSGHCPIVERFNRSFKNLVYKHLSANETYSYVHVLPDLLDTYNNREHRFLGMTPNEAEDPANAARVQDAHERHYNKVRTRGKKVNKDLMPGQLVRVSFTKTKFSRSFNQQASDEIFIIEHVADKYLIPLYYLKSWDNEELVQGGYYSEELVPVTKSDYKLTVLKKRGNKLYVSWRGWPSRYNQWINKSDITRTFPQPT